MIRKSLFTLLALFFISFGYCSNTKVIVNSEMQNEFILSLEDIGVMGNAILSVNIKKGRNEFTVDIEALQFYILSQNKQFSYVLLAPGKDFIVSVGKEGGMTFQGQYGDVNAYIATLTKSIFQRSRAMKPENLTKKLCASHIAYYESIVSDIDKTSLSKKDKNIVKGFAQGSLLKDVYMTVGLSKLFGKIYSMPMEDGYADAMAKIELLPEVTYNSSYMEYITEYCYTKMVVGDIKLKNPDNWIVEFAKALKYGTLRDAYIVYMIDREVMMGYEGGKERSENVAKLIKSPAQKAKVKEAMKGFKDVAGKGYDVSNIETVDKDGKKVLLGDFKGKYIFVDFWSTGCAPCVSEIPFMNALEHSLKSDKLDFISVTLDSDKEVWKKFMIENNMEGHQLFLVGGYKNPLCNAITMRGIPHFFVIGPDSKIVNPKIYRPSNPVLKEQLKQMVK